MKKFRIVQLCHDSYSPDRKIEWVIEQKKFWGWKEVFHIEGPTHKRIRHKSYKEAEKYLFENYTGHGICKRYGSFYTYEKYNYHTF